MMKKPKIHLNYFTLDFVANPYRPYLTNLKKKKKLKLPRGGGGVALLGIQVQESTTIGPQPPNKDIPAETPFAKKEKNYLFILVGLGWGARRLSIGHNFCALDAAASLLPWSFTRQEVHTRLVLRLFSLSLALSLSPQPNANAKKASKQNTHTHAQEKLLLCKPLHLAALQLPNRSLNFSALCTYLPRV
jgi:hypothetical protein